MKYINYVLIIIGACIALYAEAKAEPNQYLLIGGIVVLMMGIYRIARTIPSKSATDDDDLNQKEDL